MNKNCDKKDCFYYKTCIIADKEKITKCSGKLSDKNSNSPNYKMQIRGGN